MNGITSATGGRIWLTLCLCILTWLPRIQAASIIFTNDTTIDATLRTYEGYDIYEQEGFHER